MFKASGLISEMTRLLVTLLALSFCRYATAEPEATPSLEPLKLSLKPFTPETNYLSLYGFLRFRYFLSGDAPQTSSTDLTGTTWKGVDLYMPGEYAAFSYTFGKDGALTYSYKGNTYTTGTWKQKGDAVYIETNKGYAERMGLIHDNEIRGVAHNITGIHWDWSLSK